MGRSQRDKPSHAVAASEVLVDVAGVCSERIASRPAALQLMQQPGCSSASSGPSDAPAASPASQTYPAGAWPRCTWVVHPEDAALPLPTWWTPLTTARFVRPSLAVGPVTSREGGRLYVALCAGASASVVTAARDRLEQDHATHRFERAALTPELRCEVCGGLRRAIVHQLESGEVITPEQWRRRGKPRSLTRTAECWNCGGEGE